MDKSLVLIDILVLAAVGHLTSYLATDCQTSFGRAHMSFVMWIIDTVDLFIHEGGHFFFGFMGRFIYFVGGSLMQIVLPSIAVYIFLKSGYRTLIVTLYWLGHNLASVSVYIGDATYKKLPLVSNSAINDWNRVFGHVDNMNLAGQIPYVVFVLGIVACSGGVITAGYFIAKDFKETFLLEIS